MERRILPAFGRTHERHDNLKVVREHGQWWVQCLACGATWAVHKATGPETHDGMTFEQIDHGDETCR